MSKITVDYAGLSDMSYTYILQLASVFVNMNSLFD